MKHTGYFLMLLVFSLFLGTPAQLSAQEEAFQKRIEQRFKTFTDLVNAGKWADAFDMTYPKLFQIVGKQELIGMMENMEQSGISSEIRDVKIISFSDPLVVDDETFVFMTYNSRQLLTMPAPAVASDEAIEQTLSSLRQTIKNQEVFYDTGSKKFAVVGKKTLYAIRSGTEGEWFLLENNPEQKVFMQQILPQEVRDAFSQ